MTDSDFLNWLKTVDAPTLSNAIEGFKLRPRAEGFTPLSIRCLFPEMGRMAGYAVTAQMETVTQMSPKDIERYVELYSIVEQSKKPVVIVMQEVGGHGDLTAHTGEVMATIFKRLGSVGIVSDCGVRDLPEVRAMGMHYFARGAVASHANARIVRAGEPVQIGGMVVRPGDLIHGDENGLITVPECDREALKGAVDKVRELEKKLMEYVRGPEFTIEGLRERFLH